ncbi:MAG: hypothetical protein IJ234_08125 [Clostridia bacterium]|nr:hypothetical protein [Clostridia bacterium]
MCRTAARHIVDHCPIGKAAARSSAAHTIAHRAAFVHADDASRVWQGTSSPPLHSAKPESPAVSAVSSRRRLARPFVDHCPIGKATANQSAAQ